ncbi:MAG: glycerophosphodiester phosphodiesterase family protein [Flavobacteriaceae bacterium]
MIVFRRKLPSIKSKYYVSLLFISISMFTFATNERARERVSFSNKDQVIFNELEQSVTVKGTHVFIVGFQELGLTEMQDILDFRMSPTFGVAVRDVLHPKTISSPTSHIPTNVDGAFLEVFFNDEANVNANKQFYYGAFATTEFYGYQEGYWKIKSPKFKNSLYSNDIKINLFNQKVRRSRTHPFKSSDEAFPVTIKITVRNCTLLALHIPGFTEIEALRLLKIGEIANFNQLSTIRESPSDYSYTWVTADGGMWGEKIGKNTVKAFELAVEAGADILGVDTRLTKDGMLVACSDTYLDKWYDITELASRKGIPPNELRILDLTTDEFLQLNVKNINGKVLVGSHPCTIPTLLDRFPIRFFQFNPYDENFLILGQDIAQDPSSFTNEMMIQVHFMSLKKGMPYSGFDNTKSVSIVHIPLFNSLYAVELQSPEEYMLYLNALAISSQFTIEDFSPYIIIQPNTNPYEAENLFLQWLTVVEDLENNFKTDNDVLLEPVFKGLIAPFNVSIYSLYADDPLGRSYTNVDGNREVFEYKPDISANYNTDLSLDNRGNLDWVLEKGITNMIVSPRPDMVIKFLESQGKRSRNPKMD